MTEQQIKEAAEAAYPLESTLPGPYRQRLAFNIGETSQAAKEYWAGKQEPIAKTYFFDCWRSQRAVLLRLCNGDTNKAISADLGISTRVVEVHLSNMFKSTGTNCRTGLAVFALKNNLL